MENDWYIIVNPTSGNGKAIKKWKTIITKLDLHKIVYSFAFTEYKNHEQKLVDDALEKGYRKFICVGGDGTLHQIVNAVMSQNFVDQSQIKVAIIPMGTGNDWIKTYKIPRQIDKAISIIKTENSINQDIGYLELIDSKKGAYFNNIAGLGFDAFVVKNVIKYKRFGALSYLLATLTSFLEYKKSVLTIEFNNKIIYTKTLLTLVGIGNYSGGGMRLTKNVNVADGLFDISIAKNFSFLSIIKNTLRFYNGKIVNHKEVENYKTDTIKIVANNHDTFVQADGELIGTGGFTAKIIPKALRFVIP